MRQAQDLDGTNRQSFGYDGASRQSFDSDGTSRQSFDFITIKKKEKQEPQTGTYSEQHNEHMAWKENLSDIPYPMNTRALTLFSGSFKTFVCLIELLRHSIKEATNFSESENSSKKVCLGFGISKIYFLCCLTLEEKCFSYTSFSSFTFTCHVQVSTSV